MRDPFSRARNMAGPVGGAHAVPPAQAPAASAPPVAPGMPAPQNPSATANNFYALAKQAGLHHVKFDKDPVIARTQLMHHLQQKFGAGYADNPEARQLLASFNTHHGGSNVNKENMENNAVASMKHLMGRS